jgi:shikimate kinase
MKIFLIGLPGSGKTTLGKELAEQLAVSFIDLDAEVEKQEGQSIAQIFEQQGEPYFRQAEASVLREISMDRESFVMATGGGAPCFYDGIELMNRLGTTVFLDVPVDILSNRLNKSDVVKRPLFREAVNLDETIRQLRSARLKFYEQATYRLTQPDVKKLIELVGVRK